MSGSDHRGNGGRLGLQTEELTTVRTALTETERLLHELQIHQIELEIQNRALREAQDELDSSRQRFVELFESAPMAYLTVESDGRVLEANLAASEMFGQERSLLLGRRLQTVVGLTEPLVFRSLLRAVADQGTVGRAELTFRTVAQQVLVVEALAAPVRGRQGEIRLAVHDVTARATAEQNLAFLNQSGARLNRIGLGAPQLLDEVAAAGASGSVDGCWVEMNGVESVAWRTEPLRRRMVGEHLASLGVQIASTIRETRATGSAQRGRWTEELGLASTWQSVRTWVTAPLLAQGKVEGTVTLFQPIPPDREEAARALTEEFARRASMVLENDALYRRAEEATRSRDEIMAMLAHDLSNALFSFRLHAQRGQSRGGEHAQRALSVVARGSQWLLGLVRTMLDVAGGGVTVQLQPGNLSQVLESACLLQQMDADERRVRIVQAWPSELPLEFDQERIVQVVFNLLNNAVKFTPPGGRIEVGACREAEEIRIWVQDSGNGLAAAELERVFDRGWQADPKARGKGLGLYISRRIVEAHGGVMWAESTPGRGSRFEVRLPVGTSALLRGRDEAPAAP